MLQRFKDWLQHRRIRRGSVMAARDLEITANEEIRRGDLYMAKSLLVIAVQSAIYDQALKAHLMRKLTMVYKLIDDERDARARQSTL